MWPWRATFVLLGVGLLLFGFLDWGWQFLPIALIGLVAPTWRSLWALRPGPAEIRGNLVIPKTTRWQDSRVVLTVADKGVRLRLAFEPEAWDVPWASIDEFLIDDGHARRLSLMLDGTPLAQLTTATDVESLIGRLNPSSATESSSPK